MVYGIMAMSILIIMKLFSIRHAIARITLTNIGVTYSF